MKKITKCAKAGQKKHALIGVKPGLTRRRDANSPPQTEAEKGCHRLSLKLSKHITQINQRNMKQDAVLEKIHSLVNGLCGELGRMTTMIYAAGLKSMRSEEELDPYADLPRGEFVEQVQRLKCPRCGKRA